MLQLRNYVAPVSSRRVKCFADKLTPVSFIVNPFIRSYTYGSSHYHLLF